MKNKKVLKLNGLKVPKLCLFIHGFTNGRMKTAAVDSESGNLNSAYIHRKMYLFDKLCHERVIQLERELSEVRTEAEVLILELRELAVPVLNHTDETPAHRGVETKCLDSIACAQANRAAAASAEKTAQAAAQLKQTRERILARRRWIIRRLVAIRETIVLEERLCMEELSATADALMACFCTYGHGALLKPINARYIPTIDHQHCLDSYCSDHEALKKQICDALKKEVD